KAFSFIGEGNLKGARAYLRAVPRPVEQTALAAYVAEYGDYVWVLDETQRELLLRLTPSAFSSNAAWAIALAQACALKGDAPCMRFYASMAVKAHQELLREEPDAGYHSMIGLSMAYLGQKSEALREGRLAVEMYPIEKYGRGGGAGSVLFLLVRIEIQVGE